MLIAPSVNKDVIKHPPERLLVIMNSYLHRLQLYVSVHVTSVRKQVTDHTSANCNKLNIGASSSLPWLYDSNSTECKESTAKQSHFFSFWPCSSVVEQQKVHSEVVGSNPTLAKIQFPYYTVREYSPVLIFFREKRIVLQSMQCSHHRGRC